MYDTVALQSDLNNIYDWCKINNLHTNIEKCISFNTTYSWIYCGAVFLK